jgi:hypothetical protein
MSETPTRDLRLSFPLGLFCMASLTTTLVVSLVEAVNPPPAEGSGSIGVPGDRLPVRPDEPSAGSLPKKPALSGPPMAASRRPAPPELDYWDPGRDEDKYWDDGAAV